MLVHVSILEQRPSESGGSSLPRAGGHRNLNSGKKRFEDLLKALPPLGLGLSLKLFTCIAEPWVGHPNVYMLLCWLSSGMWLELSERFHATRQQ